MFSGSEGPAVPSDTDPNSEENMEQLAREKHRYVVSYSNMYF